MAKIGYARVSSIDQNLDRQLELLFSCDKIFPNLMDVISHQKVPVHI